MTTDDALHAQNGEDDVPVTRVTGDDEKAGKKKSQADLLVRLAEARYWFGTATTGEPFGVAHDGPFLARMLRGSESLRAELASLYAQENGKVPSSSALADAMLVLEGRALAQDRYELGLRVVRDERGRIVLDLGGPDGRAVVIEPGSWGLVDRSPVLFRRTELSGRLPEPADHGDLDGLRRLLNVDDASWPLAVAWMVSALIPDLPHPIALLTGEQGTGKSTAARLIVSVLDPSSAPLRTSPRDLTQWAVAASGSWMVALDNISHIKEWLSDALCRAVTGDGLVRRRLYTDGALSVLSFRRVILLTSIDPGALRGDLADRLVTFDLDRIPSEDRMLDEQLEAAFTVSHPSILAGLLDLTANVLEVLPDIHLDELPRMADYARVVAAVDKARGTDALARYLGQADRLAEDVVDGDRVASAIRDLASSNGGWSGPASELLEALNRRRPEDERTPRDWPSNARAMAAAVKRAAPALRSLGFDVEYDRDASSRRWTIRSSKRGSERPSLPSSPSSTPSEQGKRDDGSHDGMTDHPVTVIEPSSSEPQDSGVSRPTDGNDGRDGSERLPLGGGCPDCGATTHRWGCAS